MSKRNAKEAKLDEKPKGAPQFKWDEARLKLLRSYMKKFGMGMLFLHSRSNHPDKVKIANKFNEKLHIPVELEQVRGRLRKEQHWYEDWLSKSAEKQSPKSASPKRMEPTIVESTQIESKETPIEKLKELEFAGTLCIVYVFIF
jgi:hypothetical protein